MNIKNVKTQSVFTKTKKESLPFFAFRSNTGFEPNGVGTKHLKNCSSQANSGKQAPQALFLARWLSPKWLKMVSIPLLGFCGGFEAHTLLAFTTTP
jgi:hypothetical protein